MNDTDNRNFLKKVESVLFEALKKIRTEVQTHPVGDAISSIQRDVYSAIYEVPDGPLGAALQRNDSSDFAVGGGAFSDTILFFLVLPNIPTHEVLPTLSRLKGTDYVGLIKSIRARDDIQTRCTLGLKWIGHIVICGEMKLGRFDVHIGIVPVGKDVESRSAILPDRLLTPEERQAWLHQDPKAKFINVFKEVTGDGKTIYVFMMRFKGTPMEDERFLYDNTSVEKWTAVIREQVGVPTAKIVAFDTVDWDSLSVHIESIEQELPSISFGISIHDAVKKALRARGVADSDLDKIIRSESRIVVRNKVSGYVFFLYSPDQSPVLNPPVRGFP